MLTKLKLTNVCCHSAFEAEFKAGINCIAGGNGVGKSTIVSAIYSALTNSYDHPEGMRGTIKQGSDKAKIELDTDEFSVTREIGEKNKHQLTIDAQTFRAAKDIENELATRFNIVKAILDKFVFIRQGKFTEIITLPDSDRAKALAYLSNVEYFETLWKRLADEMKVHEAQLSGVPTFDEYVVKNQIEALDVSIKEYKEKLAAINNELVTLDEQACTDKLATAQQVKTAQAHAQTYATDINRLTAELTTADEIIFKFEAEYRALNASLQSTKLSEKEVNELESFNNYLQSAELCNNLWAELDKLKHDVDGYDRANVFDANVKLSNQLQTLVDRQSKLKLQLKIAENTSKNEPCEVCGAPPEAQFKGKPEILAATLAKVTDERLATEMKISSNLQILNNNDNKCNRIKELEQRLNAINVPTLGDNLEYYKNLQVRYQNEIQLREKAEKATRDLSTAVNNKNNIQNQLDTVQSYLKNDQQILQNAAIIEKDAIQAQKDLNKINENKIEIVTLNTALNEKTEHRKSLNALLTQVAQKQKQKRLQKYVDLLTEVRALAHRNNIPHIISKKFLLQLVNSINDYLEQFEAPFKAIVGDDLGFKAAMNSGAIVPATALSGGQKCMLAMAFWLSVFQTNAGRTGLLIMDEPGDGLDAANRQLFNDVLSKVDQIFQKRNQQCVLITHDESIVDRFYTIKLGTAA